MVYSGMRTLADVLAWTTVEADLVFQFALEFLGELAPTAGVFGA